LMFEGSKLREQKRRRGVPVQKQPVASGAVRNFAGRCQELF
jgi:hypothetical protein